MAKNEKKVRIFSALEVANICGVVNQTAINWIKNDYLKAFTTPGGQYRVYAEDLIDFLQTRGMRIPEELETLQKSPQRLDTIIIIDDDKDLNNVLKRYLEENLNGYTVFQAFDGYEAGKSIAENKPDIIFLDIDLPGIDGHKLCRTIKDDPSLGRPVIISITGLDDPEEKKRIFEDGADLFFPKPLDFKKVIESIRDIEKHTARR